MPRAATNYIYVAATPEFKRWLTDSAERAGTTESAFVERGLRVLAEREGLEPPPKRAGRAGIRVPAAG